jgi:hypothetical protein
MIHLVLLVITLVLLLLSRTKTAAQGAAPRQTSKHAAPVEGSRSQTVMPSQSIDDFVGDKGVTGPPGTQGPQGPQGP